MDVMPISWLAVAAAAAVCMTVGVAWYSRYMFKARWLRLTSAVDERIPAGFLRAFTLDSVMSLIMALILSSEIHFIGATGPLAGAVVGLANWLGFVFTVHATLFIYQGRSLELVAIDAGYSLVALLLMGALLGAWSYS